MNRQEIWYGLGGLAAGFIIGILLASGGGNGDARPFSGMMGGNGDERGMMRGNIDRHFIEQMIPHHEDAITMARAAETRAEHQELKDLAADIEEAQSQEIAQMQAWYREWFGTVVPADASVMMGHGMGQGDMHMGMMGDTSDLTTLNEAENFDLAFIREMIPHHQMAVMMANMLLNSTDRPEMKQLAEDIIETQTREIEQMRAWAGVWQNETR